MQVEITPKTEEEYRHILEARKRVSIPAVFLGYKRSQRTIYCRYAMLRINNVATREQAERYVGNAVEFYIPTTTVKKSGLKERTVVGQVTRVHGGKGVVLARFEKNLPPNHMGSHVFVKLYKANPNYFRNS